MTHPNQRADKLRWYYSYMVDKLALETISLYLKISFSELFLSL